MIMMTRTQCRTVYLMHCREKRKKKTQKEDSTLHSIGSRMQAGSVLCFPIHRISTYLLHGVENTKTNSHP